MAPAPCVVSEKEDVEAWEPVPEKASQMGARALPGVGAWGDSALAIAPTVADALEEPNLA